MILRKAVPALSASLISPALEQIADLPAGDRALLAAGRLSLLEDLAQVLDPCKRQRVRHSLCSVLAAAIATVLAGARSFTNNRGVDRGRRRPCWSAWGSAAIR